jgi:hypothetical protein
MLVTLLDISRTPIACKWKFNAITSNKEMIKLQMRFQVMIVMNVLSMMHWIVGGTVVEM